MNENYNKATYEGEPKRKPAKRKGKMSTDMVVNLILIGCAFVSAFFLALCRTILNFGGAGVLRGIFSIPVLGLAVAGMVLSYLAKRKPSFELFLNAGAFFMGLWFLAI